MPFIFSKGRLAKVIRRLEPNDVLVVTRLDRLARSTRDLLNVLDEISQRGAGFRSLKDTWADTTTPHGKLMLTVLGGLYAQPARLLPLFRRHPTPFMTPEAWTKFALERLPVAVVDELAAPAVLD